MGTMKFLVLLAAVGYASAASSNAVTCEECQAGAAALVDRLLSDASLSEQGEILKALVCPQTEDPAKLWQLLICGLVTWPPASTTTLFWKLMSALVLVSARRFPSSPPVTGPVRSAPTLLQELLTTWLLMKPFRWVLSTCRENASVARTVTLTTAVTLSPPSSL